MLRKCTEQEYKKYADFVYELAVDLSKSGYPTYCDGIKTKEMFLEQAENSFSRKTEEILLFEYDGTVEGWIHYYFLPEDNYLSTKSFNINSHIEIALREFLDYVQERFKGFDLFLGFSKKNEAAVDFLASNGFECIEESCNNIAVLNQLEPTDRKDDIVRITKENFGPFSALHRQAEGDMYWNTERINADIDNWIILAEICNGEANGAGYFMVDDEGWFEIYGIDMKDGVFDPKLFEGLLNKALNTAKELNGKYMTFFCEEREREITDKLGFKCVDEYICYKKHVI